MGEIETHGRAPSCCLLAAYWGQAALGGWNRCFLHIILILLPDPGPDPSWGLLAASGRGHLHSLPVEVRLDADAQPILAQVCALNDL